MSSIDLCYIIFFKLFLLGDVWVVDACTSCTCQETEFSREVKCEKIECVLEECLLGQTRQVIAAAEGTCCPSVVCTSPPENVTCPEVATPICGQDQHLVFRDVDGCPHQICECVPLSECPTIEDVEAAVGEKYVIKKTGCCPHMERICVEEECPAKPTCRKFYTASIVKGTEHQCCPDYECAPPSDACVYEFKYESDKGSKKTSKTTPTKSIQQFKINETWSDGHCVTCECFMDNNNKANFACAEPMCILPKDEDYVYEVKASSPGCCPTHHRTACKQADKTYKVCEREKKKSF